MTIDTADAMKALRRQLAGATDMLQWVERELDAIGAMGRELLDILLAGGTIWTAGNGGSATHAMHLAEELLGRYRADRRPLAAACLHADPSAMTCIANDFGYESVFSRALQGLARPGDGVVIFSTSGNSPNILKTLETASACDVRSFGLLGSRGGAALTQCDSALVVPSDDSATIQEGHHLILHLLCELIDNAVAE